MIKKKLASVHDLVLKKEREIKRSCIRAIIKSKMGRNVRIWF